MTRSAANAQHWQAQGARVAVADAHAVGALQRVFRTGRRAFLLNPPAALTTNTVSAEQQTVAAITCGPG